MTFSSKSKEHILEIWGREPESLDELAQCVIKVIDHYKYRDYRGKVLKKMPSPKVVGFAWHIHHTIISNSNYAPQTGVRNRSKDTNKPTSYPGWEGRVWIRYQSEPPSFGSCPFQSTLTYPGTGGFGSYNGPWEEIATAYYKNGSKFPHPKPEIYSWHYRFFDDDWPAVNTTLEKKFLFDVIRNPNACKYPTHAFVWNDQETLAQDRAYLSQIKELAKIK